MFAARRLSTDDAISEAADLLAVACMILEGPLRLLLFSKDRYPVNASNFLFASLVKLRSNIQAGLPHQ